MKYRIIIKELEQYDEMQTVKYVYEQEFESEDLKSIIKAVNQI